jgi:hypothetical protein
MDIATGTRTQRILWALIIGGTALYCDKKAPAIDRATIQVLVWTLGVFSLLFIELRKTLQRPKQLLIAILLVAVHAYGMFFFWHLFPFDSSFTILIVTVIETIVVGLVYIRTCQSIDPEGPFGPTDAEKHAHKSRPRI